MYSARIENKDGDVLLMTGDETKYQVLKITGLNPVSAQINTATIAGLDGAKFNSSKLETRNIVITIKINGDVEKNRLVLYQYFRTKEWCRFYYKNRSRDVYIDGYVEDVNCDYFTNSEKAQISILCPEPYFKALNEIITDVSRTLALFEFPFFINENEPIPFSEYEEVETVNIYNNSESETGVIVEIDLEKYVHSIEIKNIVTGDDIKLEYNFHAGDRVTINTNKGNKSITLLRAGVLSNLFSALQKDSSFFQLAVGDNLFTYLIDDGANNDYAYIVFKHYTVYRGV